MSSFWTLASLHTLAVVAGVLFISALVALPLAWLLERSEIPGARILKSLFTWPYVLPPYLLAVAWIILANPDVGWLNVLGQKYLGQKVFNIYQLSGIIFVESSTLFAIIFLAFRAGLERIDPSLEEAARLSGVSPVKIFFLITLPLLRNTIFLSLLTVGLSALASFGVPAMIGTPGHIFVLTTALYSVLKTGGADAFHQTLFIALRISVLTLVVVALSKFFFQHAVASGTQRASRSSKFDFGKLGIAFSFLLFSGWFGFLGLPLAALVFSSFQSDPTAFGPSTLTLRAWRYVLNEIPEFHRAVANSFILAASAALLVLALSVFLGLLTWDSRRTHRPVLKFFLQLIEQVALLLNALPGTVLALLLLIGAASFSVLDLRDSLFILLTAFVLKTLALGINTVGPALLNIHPSMIESAQLSGASLKQRLASIWIPLLKPALVASALLVFLPCLWELSMSVLLYGPGTENLGVLLFQLQDYADRPSAAVVGTLLLTVVVFFEALLRRYSRVD